MCGSNDGRGIRNAEECPAFTELKARKRRPMPHTERRGFGCMHRPCRQFNRSG
jgi:hypothetical protein